MNTDGRNGHSFDTLSSFYRVQDSREVYEIFSFPKDNQNTFIKAWNLKIRKPWYLMYLLKCSYNASSLGFFNLHFLAAWLEGVYILRDPKSTSRGRLGASQQLGDEDINATPRLSVSTPLMFRLGAWKLHPAKCLRARPFPGFTLC